MENNKKKMLKAETVAECMDVSRQTVMNWINAGILRAVVINRQYFIAKESLDKLTDMYPDAAVQEENIKKYKKEKELLGKKLDGEIKTIHWELKTRGLTTDRIGRFCSLYKRMLQVYGLPDDSMTGQVVGDFLNGMTIEHISEKYDVCAEKIRRLLKKADRMLETGDTAENFQRKYMQATAEIKEMREREKILMDMIQPQGEEGGKDWPEKTVRKLEMKISSLPFSVRVLHIFEFEDIKTVADLVNMTERQLYGLRNFGKKCMKEVKEILEDMNLQLDMKLKK